MDLLAILNDKGLRVAAYLLAACLAFAAASREAQRSGRRERLPLALWTSAGVLFVVLPISREVDLASHIAGIGRGIFRTEGWYPERRPLQKVVILSVLGTGGAATLGGAALLCSRGRGQLAFGFVAIMLLGVFLVVRAISWHDIDGVLYRSSINSVQVNALVELTVTGIAAFAAGLATLAPPRNRRETTRGHRVT